VAKAAVEAGAAMLAVASLAEAEQLRAAEVTAPILMLNAGDPRLAERVVAADLIQTLCTLQMGRALSRPAQRLDRPARVHLKIDTGMSRLGESPERIGEFVRLLRRLPGLQFEGVFTHLATAEEADTSYARLQFARFLEAVETASQMGLNPPWRHVANSAATLRFPEMRLEAVRAGLLIYGIAPDMPDLPTAIELRPALTWKTRVAFVHSLPPGRPVSYSRTYVTTDDCLAGALPLGYADGFPRTASNRAQVLVRGTRCPVIGRVCMDQIMVDLTSAGEVKVGEEVVILGRQGGAQITVNELAEWAGTVVNEVTTRIGNRVTRHYLDRGKRE
jgi:alanine racemase